jgi:membrane protein DedA with SNARE-associated domain
MVPPPAPHFTGVGWLDVLLLAMGAWGYVAALVGATLENLFIVGSFVPGETVVIAVAFAASRDPRLSIVLVWAISVLGTMAGSNLSYWIGHRGGRPLLARIVGRFPRLANGLHEAEDYFAIHGTKTVFIARFTAGFKNFVPTLAGVMGMPLVPFETYTALSAVAYTTGLAIIGYFFGSNVDVVMSWVNRAGVWALVAAGVLLALYVAYRVWRSRRIDEQVDEYDAELAEEAEEAEEAWSPDPGGEG